ncbi:MAG: hypothetical protein K2N71_12530, partial [Oscillospiraceae bacterium]|nr:hypothetical protein [Oscillospiraceae bacterium]
MSGISPIGVGISNSMAGYGGASYGMAVYRKNAADGTPVSGTSPASMTNPSWGAEPLNGSSILKNDPKSFTQNGKISEEADRKR